MKALLAVLSMAFFFAIQATPPQQSPAPARGSASTANNSTPVPVKTQIRNVDFHFSDKIVAHISSLDGTMTPNEGSVMPVFDDKNSFALNVDSASITLTTSALAADLNEFVFAAAGAPIKDLKVRTEGDDLVISGLLVKKGGIPFETVGTLSITPEGLIRVHTKRVKALHLPVKGLMDMLGLDTADLINTKKVPGVSTDKDDLILDPEGILPPPQLRGHATAIRIQNAAIVLTFGTPDGTVAQQTQQAHLTSSCGRKNFMSFKGGPVRFGKLEMDTSDLELFNSGAEDIFDFSIDHYKDQLVAGYSKVTARGGLCVHMPEYYMVKPKAAVKPQS